MRTRLNAASSAGTSRPTTGGRRLLAATVIRGGDPGGTQRRAGLRLVGHQCRLHRRHRYSRPSVARSTPSRGQTLTLTVVTTERHEVRRRGGAATLPRQTPAPRKRLDVHAPRRPRATVRRRFTVAAVAANINGNDKCTGSANVTQASYVLDNTGPRRHRSPHAGGERSGLEQQRTSRSPGRRPTPARVWPAARPLPRRTNTANGVVTRTLVGDRPARQRRHGSVTVQDRQGRPDHHGRADEER